MKKKLLILSLLLSLGVGATLFLRIQDEKELSPVGVFLQKECQHKSASGCFNLALFREESGRRSLAIHSLKKACKLGHSKACKTKFQSQ